MNVEDHVPPFSQGRARIDRMLVALASHSPKEAAKARSELVAIAADRMRSLAHRMLAGSARVRRWEETDDILQGAMLRLDRALGAVAPSDAQHFLRLAAVQVRRELIDLCRRHSHAGSMAANHETNSQPATDGRQRVDDAADPRSTEADRLLEWTRFHESAAKLPNDERALFNMIWYMGMEQEEVAAVLGSSSRTVRRRWEETKRRFRVLFADDLQE